MKRIGHYIIRGLLGRGGMGKVFRVEVPVVGKTAALKVLDPDPLISKLLGLSQLRDLFLSEAKTMARLNHPHIVELHDFNEDQGRPFYVMSYHANNLGTLIGESYRTDQPSRTIRADKALDYLRQTLEGLACLHDAGIVHRDIKPFNLLITNLDCIKICDFGLSKIRGERFSGPSQLNVGSPYYAAPEQERSPDAAGPTADFYPLGIMLYRMLTGRLPEHPPHHRDYRSVSSLNPDLDAEWDGFIARASAAAPEDRFGHAGDMLQALDDLSRHWEQTKERTCTLPMADTALEYAHPATLRSEPVKAAPQAAIVRFNLDSLWRPVNFSPPRHAKIGEALVLDRTARLLWQRAGSAYPCDWRQAGEYIRRLNAQKFAGRTTWRLPTIDELVTLLRPTPQIQDLCIAPLFDPTQRWLWSADRRSFAAAYYVDVQLAFVGWQDQRAPYYVRAVCDEQAD